jgi:hypothetical protein
VSAVMVSGSFHSPCCRVTEGGDRPGEKGHRVVVGEAGVEQSPDREPQDEPLKHRCVGDGLLAQLRRCCLVEGLGCQVPPLPETTPR